MKKNLWLWRILFIGAASVLFMGSLAAKASPTPESTWFVDMNRFSQAAHKALSCEECHGTMKEGEKAHPDTEKKDFLKLKASGVYDYSRCKTCHRKSYDDYLVGEHAKALKKEKENPATVVPDDEKKPAPTCGDCHSSHYDRAHLVRTDIAKKTADVCGACHIPQKETYLENYHGKAAVNLGYEKAATCTDCHGAHNCISLKEKEDKKLIVETCRRCHPDAGESFAGYVIHYGADTIKEKEGDKKISVSRIYIISLLSLIFIVVLLVCFYSHTFLLMLRKIHDKLRKHE